MTSSHAPTQKTATILFYATFILCIMVIAPILIYCTFKLNEYKKTIVVRKRYPNIIMIIVMLLIMNIAIRTPLTVLVVTPTTLPILNSLHHSKIITLIESFLNVYITHAAVTLIALRFWMIFYKINYTYCSSTSAWKTVINPLISCNNWFLKPSNKSKYGNAKFMFCRYFLPFYIIYGTLDFLLLMNNRWCILFDLNLSIYHLISGLYYLLVMIFCVYLYKQTPNFEDDCFIRSEMKLGSLTWFICLIFYVIDSSTFLIFEIIDSSYIENMIAIYIGLILFTVYGLLLTLYPTNKASTNKYDINININDVDLSFILSDVLSDAVLFDRFMNYLSRSFSTESLLSFIEFYHFKQFIILQFQTQLLNEENKMFIQRLKSKMQSKKHKNTKKLRNKTNADSIVIASNLWNIMFPDSVPKSYLVFGDFMVKHLINGKSIKKSMAKLEKSTSTLGIKLHEKEKEKQISTRNSSKKTRFSNIRKESATVHSATDHSYNSVRLQIPDAQYESVTEKDIYEHIETPSIVSHSKDNIDINIDINDIEESRTTTYPKHLTGGVSVEVDEHLDKNREISVTPQPSQTSLITSITTKKHHNKEIRTASITPYGSTRQRFGSNTTTATSQLSVTIDESSTNTPSLILMPLDIDQAIKKIRLIAHKLYMKYINIGSEWEINIPHRIRKKLIKLNVHNVDEWLQKTNSNIDELYHLFDDCMEEMFALMRSNVTVFIERQHYQNINIS